MLQMKAQETKEEGASNFRCEICIEPTQTETEFKNGNMCIHPFCKNCIANYIKVKVEEGNVAKIKCPALECQHTLDPISCRNIIQDQLFERWCDLLVESAVLGFERCYCPYQDCSVLVLNECSRDRKVTKAKCPNCRRYFCFQCRVSWHGGYWCNESGQLRDQNDILVGELIERKKWTRCHNCGHAVDRIGGCHAIYCRCGASFCHKCGERVHAGHCVERPCPFNWCDLVRSLFLVALTSIFSYICAREFMRIQ